MSARNTNLALLALVLLSALTGSLAFAFGTSQTSFVVVTHGVAGLAILALAPWKSAIARRSIRREGWRHLVSLGLSVTTILAIFTGILHSTGWLLQAGPLSMMQIHVGSGVLVVVLALTHFAMKTTRPRATDLSRRNLIRAGAILGVAGLSYIGVEGLMRVTGSSGASRRFTGSHRVDTTGANEFPTTQWLDDTVQRIDPGFAVSVGGRSLTASQIGFADSVKATLDCTGGWFVDREWSGVRLDRVLPPLPGGSIVVSSVTGYQRRFPVDDAANLYLVTHVNDEPLTAGHGGPVRLVAPGRRGFQWVKWVDRVDIEETPWWWQPPLPVT